MDALKYCRAALVTLASIGMLLPVDLWADTPGRESAWGHVSASGAKVVCDVALGPGGKLRGTVFDVQAQRVSGQVVILFHGGRELATAVSDDRGQFGFEGLRGGVYGLAAGGASQVFRLWTPAAAPPHSIAEVAVVTGGQVQRGQRPFAELFVSDPIVLGVIIAAAIAIPIAVQNSRSDRPAS
jgi:hypothetical protein